MKPPIRFFLGLGATLLTLACTVAPAFASGAVGGGGETQGGCPNPGGLAGFLVDNRLQANYNSDPATRISTYSFGSSVASGGSASGVPGLIEYCVYATPGMQPLSVVPGVNGANGAPWISGTAGGSFSFVRPNGDASNIPFDGSSRIMGTATWNTLPTVQTILLHITDPVVCAELYEEPGHDKNKHDQHEHDEDKHHQKDHGEDEHDDGEHHHDSMDDHGHDKQGMFSMASLNSTGGNEHDHDQYSKDDHDEDSKGDHGHDMKDRDKDHKVRPGTCFVKPVQSQTPICNQGDTTLAYNAMPFGAVNCGNPGLGFEAQSTREFGDQVALSATAGRNLVALKVLFASYGCSVSGHWNTGGCVTAPGATFTHPITANIYAVDNSGPTPSPGALLATVTQTQTIPYRPSASNDVQLCPAGGDAAAGARWFNPLSGLCQNSISTVLTFNFPSGITLPNQVIWTVAYNTSTAGYNPLGTGAPCNASAPGCPYDSLNVGTRTHPNAPYAGTDVDPNGAFLNSTSGSAYCDGGTGGTGFLRLDTAPLATPCWQDYKPEGAIVTQ